MDDAILLVVLAPIFGCSLLSFLFITLIKRYFHGRRRLSKILTAGLLPTTILIFALIIWHYIELAAHQKGPQLGYMSPLLLLIYGFPIVVVNLVVNILVAYKACAKK